MKDYAILKAVGAKNRQILLIVLLQTFISAIFGFVIGVSIAKLFEYITTSIIPTQYIIVVESNFILSVFVGVFLMSLVAAIIPIRKVLLVEPTLVFSSRQN